MGSIIGLITIRQAPDTYPQRRTNVRNDLTFRSPLGPDSSADANQTFAPSALAVNAVRDISLELGGPSTQVNSYLYRDVTAFCRVPGVNANDPRISWTGSGGLRFRINSFNTYEGTAEIRSNSSLILLALLLVCTVERLRNRRIVLVYLQPCLIAGYTFFFIYLRWQPWGNRLLLPWFISAAPLLALHSMDYVLGAYHSLSLQ